MPGQARDFTISAMNRGEIQRTRKLGLSDGKRIQSKKLAMGRVKIHFHTTTFKSMHNC